MSASHGIDTSSIKIMSGAPEVGSTSKISSPNQAPELRTQKKKGKHGGEWNLWWGRRNRTVMGRTQILPITLRHLVRKGFLERRGNLSCVAWIESTFFRRTMKTWLRFSWRTRNLRGKICSKFEFLIIGQACFREFSESKCEIFEKKTSGPPFTALVLACADDRL